MDKKEIARVLEEIGVILELKGENPFKVRAYHNAARIVEGLSEDLGELIRTDRLLSINGIGKHLAAHIQELHETGKLKEYKVIRQSVPDGVLEMLSVPGLGAKKVKTLWEQLKITNLNKLERACLAGKIAELDGFGAQSQRKIWEGLQQIKKHSGQFLFPVAWNAGAEILKTLEKHPQVQKISIAGSLRRKKEVVKDIDFVCATENPPAVMQAFVTLPIVAKIIQQGETKAAVLLKTGPQADLRCVSSAEFPFALHHFTGSKEHNVAMRSLAQSSGIKMNEYGLFKKEKLIPCKNEAEIFAKLELTYVEPELRENSGEIEAARDKKLPRLIEEQDVCGVVHCHSTWSDGAATIEQMALGAKALGLEYFGIADHSKAAYYAGGLDEARLRKQWEEIDGLNKKLKGIFIFKGIEADILSDGSVDMGDKILAELDYVVASVHSNFNLSEKEMTARVVKAVKNKYVRILGHMTGRLLLSREGFPLNLSEIFQACADHNVAIEINSNPMRLDIDWRHIPLAKEKGVQFFINPDAHSVEGIAHYRYGVGIARKGWLAKEDVINTKNIAEIKKWLQR